MNRWLRLPALLALLLASIAASAGEAPPFKESARTGQFRPEHQSVHAVDGRLTLSQYGKSGNAFDILSLDPITLVPRLLIEERRGGRFIARDERFLVIQQEGDQTNPLLVLDATTHEELGRIRLRQRISWGRIQGQRLLLVQGGGSGYQTAAPALIYSLPTLQLLRSTTITGVNDVQSWGKLIVSLGPELAFYDDQFERVGATVTFPLIRSKQNMGCSGLRLLRIVQDQAVVVANCGEIYIVNLQTRSLQTAIPAFSRFYHAQVSDGILFASAWDGEQTGDVHAFDLTSGQLLAVLPIVASHGLFAFGPQLLAMSSNGEDHYGKVTITSFTIDSASLRQGNWRLARVIDACRQGERLVSESDDIYRAIDLCRRAGIEGLVGARNLPLDIRSLVRSFATWRSRTFDQSAEATQILEWLVASGTPKEEVSAALSEASTRRKLMANAVVAAAGSETARDPMAVKNLDEREKQSEIGRVIVSDSMALATRGVPLHASGPNIIDPDGTFVTSSEHRGTAIPASDGRWKFVRIADGHTTEFAVEGPIGAPILPEQSHAAIFLSYQPLAQSVVLGDLRTGALRTLLTLPHLAGLAPGPRLAASGSTLCISYSRDLMLLDLQTLKIRKYFPDFMAGGKGADRSYITEMYIDGDRLILETYEGPGTVMVKLTDLLR